MFHVEPFQPFEDGLSGRLVSMPGRPYLYLRCPSDQAFQDMFERLGTRQSDDWDPDGPPHDKNLKLGAPCRACAAPAASH
jgi:hypothetical protein